MKGHTVKVTTMGEPFEAFVPSPIPRQRVDSKEYEPLLQAATEALAKLNIANELVTGQEWFLYGFVRKEALISSQIEGTQATLTDLLAVDEEQPHNADLEEVCNYLNAIKYAWLQMETPDGLPLSLRLLKEAHKKLMTGVRGSSKTPGEIRKVQNWIGSSQPQNAVFVPPPPEKLINCLSDLEHFIHDKSEHHPLIKISMVHVQFETIHPFLDGNGRLGRLLIALMLKEYNLLQSPLLYLSLYFKKNKQDYYKLLNEVRFESSWSEWNQFFLKGVIEVSANVVETAKKLNRIVSVDREKVLHNSKSNITTARLFEMLPNKPVLTHANVVKDLELTKPPALKAISNLVDMSILKESTGKKRDRVYQYKEYVDVLSAGTELTN